MRRAAKVDATQAAIVQALRSVGVQVEVIKQPVDLLLCHRGETSLMEVKNRDGRDQLTKAQIEFIARWPGKIHIAHGPQEAVEMVLGKAITA